MAQNYSRVQLSNRASLMGGMRCLPTMPSKGRCANLNAWTSRCMDPSLRSPTGRGRQDLPSVRVLQDHLGRVVLLVPRALDQDHNCRSAKAPQ